MRNYLYLLLMIFASVGLTACNTTEGIGKDVSAAGEAIEEAAEEAEDEM